MSSEKARRLSVLLTYLLGGLILITIGVIYILYGEFRWELFIIAAGIFLIAIGVAKYYTGEEFEKK